MMDKRWDGPMEPAGACRWRIPKEYNPGMRVDGIVYASDSLLEAMRKDLAAEQVVNVAFLPGIQRASMAMPDVHWGYGFPIGGVAATDPEQGGVVSPGGVGYDINCGVRLIKTNLVEKDVRARLEEMVSLLFGTIPCGVGVEGRIRFSAREEKDLMADGAKYVVSKGYGWKEDLDHTEAHGCLPDADPDAVGDRAYERGKGQCGTLGAGNHFAEIQVVDEVYDAVAANVFGLSKGQVTVMIHCGSRGLGHQVCDDFLKSFRRCPQKYGIELPDMQLVCAPVHSPEGQSYLKAMRCAANYAWANRQVLTYLAREAFSRHFGKSAEELGMSMIYDVAHNIAKIETHEVDGQMKKLCVHRKGATRAFAPGHPEVPEEYRAIGQPVLIPGDMGRYSYLLVGQEGAMRETWGSTCHGAGRAMSRHEAIRRAAGRSIQKELAAKGIVARARSREGLAEEQPEAYKDVNEVVDVVHAAGLSKKVCRMRPVGVIKG
jgi:tRNA-splicing ligase RtcB (3'-phosphate/5'-hydroxy nucleic acid ligase)